MLLGMFRVRLADADAEGGWRRGLVGTVVGQEWIPPQKQGDRATPIYQVLWFNLDEDTGVETPADVPAPSFESPENLRAYVDEFSDSDSDYDYLEDDYDGTTQSSTSNSRNPEAAV